MWLGSGRRLKSSASTGILAALLLMAFWASHASVAVPVSITIPFSPTLIPDADLDGDPSTGTWGDALSVDVPLENGQAGPVGVATMYVKHDGSSLYFRLDGAIDVPWASATADHFWLGIQISPTDTSHHGGGKWDGTFFGLWDGVDYTPQPTYPPKAVDTNGFGRPPAKDSSQNVVGTLTYSGTASPYVYTAEWRRPLNSGDPDDLTYEADGTTTYNFFITTDSDENGSSGGTVSHSGVTNLNRLRIAVGGGVDRPPTIRHTPPLDARLGTEIALVASVEDEEGAVGSVKVNYTGVLGEFKNETMTLSGTFYTYTIPAQDQLGTVTYFIWATDNAGNEARTPLFAVSVTKSVVPPSLTVAPAATAGCLLISWDPVQSDDVAGYRLHRWNASRTTMEPIAELPPSATSYEDCSLEYNHVYSYWIVALDDAGNESPPSALANNRTIAPPPKVPDFLPYQLTIAILLVLAIALSIVVAQHRRFLKPRN